MSYFSITDFVKSGHKSLEGELPTTKVAGSSLFYKKENRDVRGEKEFSYPNKKIKYLKVCMDKILKNVKKKNKAPFSLELRIGCF